MSAAINPDAAAYHDKQRKQVIRMWGSKRREAAARRAVEEAMHDREVRESQRPDILSAVQELQQSTQTKTLRAASLEISGCKDYIKVKFHEYATPVDVIGVYEKLIAYLGRRAYDATFVFAGHRQYGHIGHDLDPKIWGTAPSEYVRKHFESPGEFRTWADSPNSMHQEGDRYTLKFRRR